MASIIKADTLQSTTSNVFVLNSAGTEYARFDSSGVFQLANPTTFPAGTTALPSITTLGDTNTGIFFPAADTIAFAKGGAEAMRIDSSGNVMVGTTTSQTGAKLAVTGGIQGIITSGTAVATTSGTSIDFTNIPSWVKRISVLLNSVSLSGSANIILQIGAGSIVTTGYASVSIYSSGAGGSAISATNGYCINNGSNPVEGGTGIATICLLNSSTGIWVMGYTGKLTSTNNIVGSGLLTLSGTLDRIRFTTTNGTDTFDLGSINIFYEG